MKLSILISAYNRPAMLSRLLDSIDRQTDSRFQVLIADDNSSNPEVGILAKAFIKRRSGGYVKSRISEEERVKSCRYSATLNVMLPYADGDIVVYLADDHEIAESNLIRYVLDFFEKNPEVGAGYVGLAYRLADYKSGKIVTVDDLETILEAKLLARMRQSFQERAVILREYPECIGYGGILKHVFAVIDCAQFFHRREYAVYWDEDPKQWMGADALAMEQICIMTGGVHPIGDPTKDTWMYSNLNEGSLTVQGSAEGSIKVLCS